VLTAAVAAPVRKVVPEAMERPVVRVRRAVKAEQVQLAALYRSAQSLLFLISVR
jgi:hypothetical protein